MFINYKMSGIRNIQNNQINQKIKEMQQSDNKLTRDIARYLINKQKKKKKERIGNDFLSVNK